MSVDDRSKNCTGELIHRVRSGETLAVAELAAEAFHNLDVARWTEADSAQRRRVLIGLFELLAEHALESTAENLRLGSRG